MKPKPKDDLDRLTEGLNRQSQRSKWAAIAAAFAALFQGISLLIPAFHYNPNRAST